MRRRLKRSRPPVVPRLPDWSSVAGSARVARMAGANPKETVVRTASAVVNARTRQSIPRSRKTGFCCVLMKATSMRLVAKAKNNPQIDPATASNRLSESSSRTIRQRVAPSARRMVICRSRALVRASIKLARLAQAMSKTSPEIPRSNHRDVSESARNSENPVLAENAPSLYSRYFFVPSAS